MAHGKADVVVIGGGAAGIAAGRALRDAGVDVVLLEARERLGGRVFTHRDGDTPVPIELGAEFIHGSAGHLNDLLRQAKLASVDVTEARVSPSSRWMNSSRAPSPRSHVSSG